MGNPVGGRGPRDPLRVEPVEQDKLTRENPKEPEETSKENLGTAALLLQMFQKAVDFFIESREGSKSIEQDALDNLLLLKAAFEILKKEDRSQDSPFLNQLSKIWHHILEDGLRFQKNTAIAERLRSLIRKIQHYPENQPHTFGYYLAEYAGQKWIPFPYMELVAKLHSEHEKNPPLSVLTQWTILIDEIVVLLKPE